ncbi:MAG: hypothetical protein KY476_22690, partial [Planctomycetes bacterium]|nr:hypothetical protein [Planctomycetota bacterium]
MLTAPTSEEAIFNEARRIADPAERAEWLRQACGDDAALQSRVEALLAVHDEERSFLESPAAAIAPTIDMPPIAERPG